MLLLLLLLRGRVLLISAFLSNTRANVVYRRVVTMATLSRCWPLASVRPAGPGPTPPPLLQCNSSLSFCGTFLGSTIGTLVAGRRRRHRCLIQTMDTSAKLPHCPQTTSFSVSSAFCNYYEFSVRKFLGTAPSPEIFWIF